MDFGLSTDGFIENRALDTLILQSGASLRLIDLEHNGNRGGAGGSAEALYARNIFFGPGASVDLNGLRLYYQNGGTTKQLYMGDATLDGIVDMKDYTTWFANYGRTAGADWYAGDFNGDGIVDMHDYVTWFNNFGEGSLSVPEPGTLALLALGAPLLYRRARKR
ncbi:MAG: PEP-CTERM sorting domain-containing protein [Phycisphaerae bacterium]